MKKIKRVREYPTREEILLALPKLKRPIDRLVIRFCIDSGVRKAEILGLRRRDINLKERVCKVLGKGNKERFVLFTEETAKEMQKYFETTPENGNAFSMTVNKLRRIVYRLSLIMGKKIFNHALRHVFASSCYSANMDIIGIQKLLGHVSLTSTQVYIQSDLTKIKEDYKRLIG